MDEENVQYSFTGDVSSLKEATEQAIKLLDSYQDQIERLAGDNAFGSNQRAAKSFSSALNSTMKEVNKLQQQMRSLSDVRIPTGSTEAALLKTSINEIEDVLQKLATSSKLSTKDVRELTSTLKQARQGFVDSSDGIDTFVQREERFQQTLNNISASTQKAINSVRNMGSRLSSLFDPFIAKLNTLKNPFVQLTTNIQSFRDRAASALNRVTQMAGAVAASFKKTQQGTSEAADGASRFASIWNRLTTRLKNFTSQTEKTGQSVKKLANQTKQSTNIFSNFGNQLSRTTTQSNSLNRSLQRLLSAAAGVSLGKAFGEAIQESISYVENLNLFTVAMGDSVDEGMRFVETMSEIYGMDPSNLYRYAGYFYQLTDAIGMTDDASRTLSLSLTKASNDIASLFNVDIETVVDNLAAGMQGQSRAVRKYGMDIRTSTLQQTAFNYGLTESVENMSEANRMALRYITMMEQVQNATKQVTTTADGATIVMGDFARNIETPANQLRVFKEQITQLGRAIGNFFIPILSKVLPLINGFVMALRTALEYIAAFIGIDSMSFGGAVSSAEEETAAIGAMGEAADDTAKKLKNLTAPFDELNILSEDTAASAGAAGGIGSDMLDPRLQEAIEAMELQLDDIRMKAVEVRDALLDFFGFDYVSVFNPDTGEYEQKLQWFADKFKENLIDVFPNWSKTITAIFDNWSDIVDAFGNVFNALGNVIGKVIKKLKNFFGMFINDDTVSGFIENLADNLNALADWINEHSDALANLVIVLGAIWAGFQVFQGLAPIVATIGSAVATIAGLGSVLTGLASSINPVFLVIGAILLLSSTAETFGATFESIIGNVGNIVSSTFDSIQKMWITMLQPTIENFIDAIENLMDIFAALWDTTIGPIMIKIGDVFESVWVSTVLPILEQVVDAITGVMDIILGLWNNVLSPLVEFLINTFGPAISSLAGTILTIVQTLVNNIGDIIEGLLTMLNGIIDFLAGVFTGDWKRAFQGIANIFVGFVNTLISVFESAINFIISLINLFVSTLYNLIVTVVNAILGGIQELLDFVGVSVDLTFTNDPPQMDPLSIPRVPAVKLASGGVVTKPTNALVGEGRYDEAVIPLGNSPQMQDLVQQIADAVKNNPNNNSDPSNQIIVKVYIGGKEYDAFTYKAAKRGEKLVGAQPVKVGGTT